MLKTDIQDEHRFILLDIDGPMIPYGMFFIDSAASANRKFSPISIAIVNRLCEKTGAKIITNSNHNWQLDKNNRTLKESLVIAGIHPHHFCSEWRTNYGKIDVSINKTDAAIFAIQSQIKLLGSDNDFQWVGFDDESINLERYIKVDFDLGITPKDYQTALGMLGSFNSGIIM